MFLPKLLSDVIFRELKEDNERVDFPGSRFPTTTSIVPIFQHLKFIHKQALRYRYSNTSICSWGGGS